MKLFNFDVFGIGKSLLIVMLALVIFVPLAEAQWTKNAQEIRLDRSGRVFAFQTTVDSVENDTSKTFSLDGFYIDSTARFGVGYTYKQTSSAGTAACKVYLQGSMGDSNWTAVQTIFGATAVDSTLETLQSGNLFLYTNNPAGTIPLYAYYRIIFDGQPGNRSDNVVRLRLHPWKRNN